MNHKSDADEPLDRATALIPALRARAAEAEELRRLPDANVAALKAAGSLLGIVVPPPRLYI